MTLSVIIPGYKTPDALWDRCLRSVLAAIGPDDEVLCVDDGSPERPHPAVEDPRVKWFFLNKNVGQSAARNKAIELAQGEYVAFVDSDDEVLCDIYKRSLVAARRLDRDIVAFGIRTIWVYDGLQMASELPARDIGLFGIEEMSDFTERRLFDCPVNKIYRRSFLKDRGIKFPEGICPGEDAMFVLDCIMKGASWASVAGVGYLYYRMDGTTLSRYQPNLEATLAYWKEHWDAYLTTIGKGYAGWWPTKNHSPAWVAKMLWQNMWRYGSTVSLAARWRFLKAHPELCRLSVPVAFLQMAARSFVRRHCYFRALRRWHLKRQFAGLVEFQPRGKTTSEA